MKNSTERFIVKEVCKFGMLFGYVVFDTVEKNDLPYEFDESEKPKAESKCALKNALNKL